MVPSYQVEVKVSFRSGHRLMPPYKGKCNNVHGEYFTAIFILEQEELDVNGMLIDFGVVKKQLKTWTDDNLDHAYLHNEGDEVGKYLTEKGFKTYSVGPRNPTAENLARMLYGVAKRIINLPVVKVGVVESTETSIAWFTTKG